MKKLTPFGLVAGITIIAACHGKAEFPSVHRETAETCPRDPRLDEVTPEPHEAAPAGQCNVNADCTEGKNGRCLHPGHERIRCTYDTCAADADCKTGEACACDRDGNHCVTATCRTDADCGGLGCSPSSSSSCNGRSVVVGVYCHTKKDSCTDDDDCGRHENCEYEPTDARWICVDHGVCVG
ncbi:hypothetical protein BH09MYX1_BH09MYX1_48500 [soil metagenome]